MKVKKTSYLTLSPVKTGEMGNNLFSTRPILSMDPHRTDRYHVTTETDSLESLAFKYYGNQEWWWVLADVNGIAFPMSVEIGKVLRIPDIERVKAEIEHAKIV